MLPGQRVIVVVDDQQRYGDVVHVLDRVLLSAELLEEKFLHLAEIGGQQSIQRMGAAQCHGVQGQHPAFEFAGDPRRQWRRVLRLPDGADGDSGRDSGRASVLAQIRNDERGRVAEAHQRQRDVRIFAVEVLDDLT